MNGQFHGLDHTNSKFLDMASEIWTLRNLTSEAYKKYKIRTTNQYVTQLNYKIIMPNLENDQNFAKTFLYELKKK